MLQPTISNKGFVRHSKPITLVLHNEKMCLHCYLEFDANDLTKMIEKIIKNDTRIMYVRGFMCVIAKQTFIDLLLFSSSLKTVHKKYKPHLI